MRSIAYQAAERDIEKILDQVVETGEPIKVVRKKGNVIIMKYDDLMAMEETLKLLSIPGMRDSILEGYKEPIENCISEKEVYKNK